MRKISILLAMIFITTLILAACGKPADSGAAKAVEAYLNALVSGDGDRMAALSCANWEENAMLELDSFMAVKASLEGLQCTQTGTDGDTALVTCDGKIITTYNEEKNEIDLNTRSYELTQSAGEWLVCGYR